MRILKADPYSMDADYLMMELSRCLKDITGDSGQASFDPEDVCIPRALFVIAYTDDGEAVGCGAIRPLEINIAEVKRMYAKTKYSGIGTQILRYLEEQAKSFGYSYVRLETRLVNEKAVSFYERRGYHRIENYGKYRNRPEAICFEKHLEGLVNCESE